MKDNKIKEIANKIKNAGGNLYLVGGAVRDKILENKDFRFYELDF